MTVFAYFCNFCNSLWPSLLSMPKVNFSKVLAMICFAMISISNWDDYHLFWEILARDPGLEAPGYQVLYWVLSQVLSQLLSRVISQVLSQVSPQLLSQLLSHNARYLIAVFAHAFQRSGQASCIGRVSAWEGGQYLVADPFRPVSLPVLTVNRFLCTHCLTAELNTSNVVCFEQGIIYQHVSSI